MAKFASLDSLRAIRDWVKEKFQSKLPEISATDNGKVLSVVEGQWAPTELQEELPEVTSADNGKVLAVVAGEWEKAEAPDGLPPVQSADNGKVLTVVEGEWAKADVPDELPAVSASDNGKVLGVVEGQWAKTEPEDGLPEVTSSDNGKVLSVVEGAWAPAEPTGGSGLPEVTSADNGDILSVVDGAWAKSEPGYRVENSETVIAPSQSVTTEAQGPYNYGQFTATVPDPLPDSVNVTFDGTSYENVPKHTEASLGGIDIYGDIAFSEYPFVILISSGESAFLAQAAGTYTIAITAQVQTVTPNDDFKAAVKASGAGQAPLVVHVQFDTVTASADKTYDAILAAYNAGQAVIFKCENYLGTVPNPPGNSEISAYAIKQDDYHAFYAYFTFVRNNAVHTVCMTCEDGSWICYYSHT